MVTSKIPILDLSPEIEMLWDTLNETFRAVLRSGHFILGPSVRAFEAEVASYLNVKHAVGVNSGTDALLIGLQALGIKPGDEVITTPFSFIATPEAISHLGAIPVFVDIDPETFNLDARLIEGKITSRTRAVLPVHLYGHAADMDVILSLAAKYNLKVLEDVAQAMSGEYKGRKLGTIGDIGAFSFFPSKNLGAFGDGGLLATNDDRLAETARMLRAHGARRKYFNEVLGYNSRLDELQAALLRVKLPYLDGWTAGRRQAAERYSRVLNGVPGIAAPREASYAKHAYHQYTIRVRNRPRDQVQKALAEAGISTMTYYPVPLHRLPVYAGGQYDLPQAEQAATEVLSLPMWPQIGLEVQECVASELRAALAHC